MRRPRALFALLLGLIAPAGAEPPGALVEAAAGPYRVQVERVSMFETRSLEGPGRSQSVQRSCALVVRLEAAAPEALQAVLGIGPDVRATDDTGQRLSA